MVISWLQLLIKWIVCSQSQLSNITEVLKALHTYRKVSVRISKPFPFITDINLLLLLRWTDIQDSIVSTSVFVHMFTCTGKMNL